MLNPLLDVSMLEFRPFEETMDGWYVWRHDDRFEIVILDSDEERLWSAERPGPLKYFEHKGEFAGPIL